MLQRSGYVIPSADTRQPEAIMRSASEHHEEAERRLEEARTEQDSIRRRLILAEAQVHAILALSAPAGKGPPGPGQDEAADTESTGTAHQAPPPPSPGTPTSTPPVVPREKGTARGQPGCPAGPGALARHARADTVQPGTPCGEPRATGTRTGDSATRTGRSWQRETGRQGTGRSRTTGSRRPRTLQVTSPAP
jgi:hypothetical protein